MNNDDLLDRARAKINPYHVDVTGTDSHLINELVQRIDALEQAIRETIEDNLHLADGDVCTLIKLKRAL